MRILKKSKNRAEIQKHSRLLVYLKNIAAPAIYQKIFEENEKTKYYLILLPESLQILIYQFLELNDRAICGTINQSFNKLFRLNSQCWYFSSITLPADNDAEYFSSNLTEFCFPYPIVQFKYLHGLYFSCPMGNEEGTILMIRSLLIQLADLLVHLRSLEIYGIFPELDSDTLTLLPSTLKRLSLFNVPIPLSALLGLYISPLLQFHSLKYLTLNLTDEDADFSLLNNLHQLEYLRVLSFNQSILKLKQIKYLKFSSDKWKDINNKAALEEIQFVITNMPHLVYLNSNVQFGIKESKLKDYFLGLRFAIDSNNYKLHYFWYNEVYSTPKITRFIKKYANYTRLTTQMDIDDAFCFKSYEHKFGFFQELLQVNFG